MRLQVTVQSTTLSDSTGGHVGEVDPGICKTAKEDTATRPCKAP